MENNLILLNDENERQSTDQLDDYNRSFMIGQRRMSKLSSFIPISDRIMQPRTYHWVRSQYWLEDRTSTIFFATSAEQTRE